MSAQAVATTALAALDAALSPRRAYDLDQVPSPRPAQYVEIGLSRMFGGERRVCAGVAVVGYRLTVRAVSQTTISSVRADLEKCRTALEFARLSVGSEASTPIQFETDDPAGYDDGWFSGLHAYTFAI